MTVTSKKPQQPLTPGTRVTISSLVDPLRPYSGTIVAPYPDGVAPGTGYLCIPRSPAVCGDSSGISRVITTVTTQSDHTAKLNLRYWAPGLIFDEATGLPTGAYIGYRIRATAGKKQGQRADHFRDYQNLLYTGRWQAPVSFTQVWADLASGRIDAKTAWSKISGKVPGGAQAAGEDYAVCVITHQDFKPALVTWGLGGSTWTLTDPKNWVNALQGLFTGAFSNFDDALVALPSEQDGYAGFGLFARMGRTLDNDNGRQRSKPQTLTLRAFEVSLCDVNKACGPGYATQPPLIPGAAGTLTTPGMHPFVYVQLQAEDSAGLITFRGGFIIPYQAEMWMPAKPSTSCNPLRQTGS